MGESKSCNVKGCETKALPADQIQTQLSKISGWNLSADQKSIEKNWVHKNFTDAVCFLNRAAELAEEANHHPDLHLTDYKKMKIVLSTHAAGGLTKQDFALAAQIDQIKI